MVWWVAALIGVAAGLLLAFAILWLSFRDFRPR